MNKTKRTVAEGYNGEDALDKAADAMMARELYCNQSSLVDAILQTSESYEGLPRLPSFEDINNLYEGRCPECGETTEGADDDDDGAGYECSICEWSGDYAEREMEPCEIMEWYLVSAWLADKLEERGHVTLWDGGFTKWWGRCCSGQAIKLDGIMQRIVCETGYCGWPKGKLEPEEVTP